MDGCVFFHQVQFPRGKYHLLFQGPARALFPKVATAYAQAFGVRVAKETREVDVQVLQADPGRSKELPVSKEPGSSGSGASMGGVFVSCGLRGDLRMSP